MSRSKRESSIVIRVICVCVFFSQKGEVKCRPKKCPALNCSNPIIENGECCPKCKGKSAVSGGQNARYAPLFLSRASILATDIQTKFLFYMFFDLYFMPKPKVTWNLMWVDRKCDEKSSILIEAILIPIRVFALERATKMTVAWHWFF